MSDANPFVDAIKMYDSLTSAPSPMFATPSEGELSMASSACVLHKVLGTLCEALTERHLLHDTDTRVAEATGAAELLCASCTAIVSDTHEYALDVVKAPRTAETSRMLLSMAWSDMGRNLRFASKNWDYANSSFRSNLMS